MCLVIFVVGWAIMGEPSIHLLLPIALALIFLFRLYKLYKNPIFLVSSDAIIIPKPQKTVPFEKITSVHTSGKDKLELMIRDGIPVPLFIGELSSSDRIGLKEVIMSRIGKKEKQ